MSASAATEDTLAGKRDHRQEVTDSIIAMLENGVAPWQKPWEGAAMPFNPTSERPYRGGNTLHLMATALTRGYDDPRWMTYKQAAEQGWQVRKGMNRAGSGRDRLPGKRNIAGNLAGHDLAAQQAIRRGRSKFVCAYH